MHETSDRKGSKISNAAADGDIVVMIFAVRASDAVKNAQHFFDAFG